MVNPTTTGDSDKAEVSSAVAANSDCITATFCEAELSVLALAHSLPAAADETATGAGHPEAGTEDEVTSFVAANRDEAELTCPVPEWGSGHCLGVEAGVVAAPAGDSDSVLTVLTLSEQPGSSSLPEESPVPLPTLEMEEKSPITTSSGLLMRSTSSTRPTTSR